MVIQEGALKDVPLTLAPLPPVAPTINLPATSQLVGPVSSYLLIPVTFSPGMPNQTNVSWTRGGQTLSPDTDPRLTLHDNGSLAINDLQADDRGTYRVTVANTGGSDFHEFEVRVNCELGGGDILL